ncbi:MAG: alpha-galactosidase [Eubacterium sp.]|nr:alpha-galactosidase [Eubacterium sp.]
MIIEGTGYYLLNTRDTSYIFRITKSGHLEHLYYGKRIRVTDSLDGLVERREFVPGNNNVYSPEYPSMTLNDMCLEVSFEGKGDNREAFLVVENSDGSRTSDFLFEVASIDDVKPDLDTLPTSYPGEEKVDHLEVVLSDSKRKLKLVLNYYVFEQENVITRTAKLINESENAVRILKFMSGQLDFNDSNFIMSTFNGAWAREMYRNDTVLTPGKHVSSSFTGTSSSNANPFFMIWEPSATQDHGNVYGFNLVYSSNHLEMAEVNEFGKLRVQWGINPRAFRWTLGPGESFESPEAVATFSSNGFNGMSVGLHNFVRKHITRGKWASKERPVLLNSWEAAYFDINEKKLLKLAKAGKEVGIELFVMDDGWFGERNDDTSSLGDWTVNKKKLPNGVKGLADKINKMGMSFGIWVEPEMVNVKSWLYESHPDWAIALPGVSHSEGRNQRILDLGREDVQEFIIDSMSGLFSSANIEYVKWDMNRTLTDIYSTALDEDRQGEVTHRYVMGLYRCLKVLTEKYPDILFEGCASGGNRFDLGVLCYFPQIWGSDDTDAIVRTRIQTGYSYGYPQSCWGAHVSGVPNHQTLRVTPLESRFAVASFGSLGYECNLSDLSSEEKGQIKEQIETYIKYRRVFQFGQMYRGRTFDEANSNITEWTVVSPDRSKAVGMIIQKLAEPNSQYQYFRAVGLDEDRYYHFFNREIKVNIKEFGDLVNTVSPIHIKPGSFTQNIVSKHYKLEGDRDYLKLFGGVAMSAGIKLLPAYAGTGFNSNTRVFSDFAARLYFFEEEPL